MLYLLPMYAYGYNYQTSEAILWMKYLIIDDFDESDLFYIIMLMMSNKCNNWGEQSLLSVRVANIKFSVFRKGKVKSKQSSISIQAPQKMEVVQQRSLSRNSFIPSTFIKTKITSEHERKFSNSPLFPVHPQYSKFPFRRPKSVKAKSYFPIYRERIGGDGSLNLSSLTQKSKTSLERRKSPVLMNRASTNSCLILNQSQKEQQKEKESFVRYSHLNAKRDFRDNNSRSQRIDSHQITLEKIYF